MSHSNQLSTVHDAMSLAQNERADTKEPYTVKVSPELRELAQGICERHGTTLPAFLRGCMSVLVADYLPTEKN